MERRGQIWEALRLAAITSLEEKFEVVPGVYLEGKVMED